MTTLDDIQQLVNKAWEADDVTTKEVLIPDIKSALNRCIGLKPKIRRDLVLRIPKLLNEKTLQGPLTSIDVKKLAKQLEAGIVPFLESEPTRPTVIW